MSLAPAAYTLFQKVMRHDPADPDWTGRDRFVLSAGHSSLTLNTQLYLAGFGLELDDLESFPDVGAPAPRATPSTGTPRVWRPRPARSGQGVANAVGMAMAARYECGPFDPDTAQGESPFDHFIYAIAGDGCLQEGISHEVSSLAGHQKLEILPPVGRQPHLDRGRHRDGGLRGHRQAVRGVRLARAARRAEAGRRHRPARHLQRDRGREEATDKPSFIAMRSIIAWPAPHAQNTEAAHGSALGEDEVAATKRVLGFDPEKSFEVADEVLAHTRQALDRGREAKAEWKGFQEWRTAQPERAAEFDRIAACELPAGWEEKLPAFEAGKGVATRAASGKVLAGLRCGHPRAVGAAPPTSPARTTRRSTELLVPAGRQPAAGREPVRPHDPLRHPRALHGRGDERHHAARQHPCLRRHLPGVLRLHAQRRASVRSDAPAGDVRVDARLHRSR